MKKKFNLFLNTRHLENKEEDHLTEFFAALILLSPSFRKRFEKLVLSPFFKKQYKRFPNDGWKDAHIEDVETQKHYEKERRIVDMVLHLSNGKQIACEHKITSPESSQDEEGKPDQLFEYLHLPEISGLVYIRERLKRPEDKVLGHDNYISPVKKSHFQWRDFYYLLQREETLYGQWVFEAFKRLRYVPPAGQVGEMSGTNEAENKKNRENYKLYMDDTLHFASGRNWRLIGGSIEGTYFDNCPIAMCRMALSSAAKTERFLFRVTPHEGMCSELIRRLNTVREMLFNEMRIPTELKVRSILRPGKGKEDVIDIMTTLKDILGTTPTERIGKRLLDFHKPLLMALERQ